MSHDEWIGKQLGDFTLREHIGEGGMAVVYRAHQRSVNRDVALKVIDFLKAPEPDEFRARFANEAAIIASLEHIHILPVHDYGLQDNVAYLAMRLLRGGSLRDLLKMERLPIERVGALFTQIALGLAYAHSRGVVHRDLKPANILLDEGGNAYLTDFGLAKLIRQDTADITKSGNVMGTLSYMSPEQLRGQPLDHRSDIYSLGIVLYHMTCGKTPFEGDGEKDAVSIIYQHLQNEPTPPKVFNPDIPPLLESIILKSLAKSRDMRFATAETMAQAVQAATGISSGVYSFPSVNTSQESTERFGEASDSGKTRPAEKTYVPGRIGLLTLPQPLIKPVQKHKRKLQAGAALAIILIVLFVLSLLIRDTQPSSNGYTVRAGEQANADGLTPTQAQIQLARTQMGEDGFIAIIACNMSSEFHATMNREMVEFARAYGLPTRIYDPDSDSYAQRTRLELAIAEGASAFAICPIDFDILEEPLMALENSHRPVIYFSQPEKTYGGVVLATKGDNYEIGLKVGHFAGEIIQTEQAGQANVIILDFPDMSIIVDRANGMEEGVKEVAPDVNIVGRYLGATQENGKSSVQELIADGVVFNVILSINDAGAYGAIDALVDAGISPENVFIASVDAEDRALQYINEGYYLRGSLSVGRRESAQTAIDLITLMLANESVPENVIVPSNTIITRNNP